MHVHTRAHPHLDTPAHTYLDTHIVDTHTSLYTCAHMCTHIHTCMCMHTNTHTHTACTQVRACRNSPKALLCGFSMPVTMTLLSPWFCSFLHTPHTLSHQCTTASLLLFYADSITSAQFHQHHLKLAHIESLPAGASGAPCLFPLFQIPPYG